MEPLANRFDNCGADYDRMLGALRDEYHELFHLILTVAGKRLHGGVRHVVRVRMQQVIEEQVRRLPAGEASRELRAMEGEHGS